MFLFIYVTYICKDYDRLYQAGFVIFICSAVVKVPTFLLIALAIFLISDRRRRFNYRDVFLREFALR